MQRGEIWWVNFDPAVGSEIRKYRPAVIISNDIANTYLSRVVVVPLTSNTSKVYPGECLVDTGEKIGKAMSDQIVAVDKQRLVKQFGRIKESDMQKISAAVRLHLGL